MFTYVWLIFDFIVVRNFLVGLPTVIVLVRTVYHVIGVLGSLLVICVAIVILSFARTLSKYDWWIRMGLRIVYNGIIRKQLGVVNIMTKFENTGYFRQYMSHFSEW